MGLWVLASYLKNYCFDFVKPAMNRALLIAISPERQIYHLSTFSTILKNIFAVTFLHHPETQSLSGNMRFFT